MKAALSHKKNFILTLLGYVIIGAASSGFYQQRYFGEEGLSPFVWIGLGLAGAVILIAKNILDGNRVRAALTDLCFIVPTVLVPLIPARHDVMLIVMLVYACAFIALHVFKNYKAKGT